MSPDRGRSPQAPARATAWSAGRWPTWKPKASRSRRRCSQYIHRSKTAALIRASVAVRRDCRRRAGGRTICRACARFGDQIGWAFQVTDDILDVEESSAALGKPRAKIRRSKKPPIRRCLAWRNRTSSRANWPHEPSRSWNPTAPAPTRLRELGEFLVLRRTRDRPGSCRGLCASIACTPPRKPAKSGLDVLLVERGLAGFAPEGAGHDPGGRCPRRRPARGQGRRADRRRRGDRN